MDFKINSLESNDTFEVTELPEDKQLVGGNWADTTKGEAENRVYKARYVAKGYSQVQGTDYSETLFYQLLEWNQCES